MPLVPPRRGSLIAHREGRLQQIATGLAAFTAGAAVCLVAAIAVVVAIT
jgi:hypothetical protein